MVKDKVCKNCGFLTKEDVCNNCGSDVLLEKFKGRVLVIDPENSEIAKKLNIKTKGVYALKY